MPFKAVDMIIERSPHPSVVRTQGYQNAPPSMCFIGGIASWITALHCRLDNTRIFTAQTVRQLNNTGQYIDIAYEDGFGQINTLPVLHVLLALPPRLVPANLMFKPALSPV